MPNFIVISERKQSKFSEQARSVLESSRFSEILPNTFMGSGSSSPVVTQLKNLETYNKERSSCGIELYHGSLSRS